MRQKYAKLMMLPPKHPDMLTSGQSRDLTDETRCAGDHAFSVVGILGIHRRGSIR